MRARNPLAGLIDPGPIEFMGIIERSDESGAGSFVPFPFDLKSTYGKGNLVPVRAVFDGCVPYSGSLVMMGGDCALLGVRKDILAQLGKQPNDSIHVRVELDTVPRVVECPADATQAMDAVPAACAFWNGLSYSNQCEYVQWIEDAKRPETRQRRIDKMVEMLAAGRRLKS